MKVNQSNQQRNRIDFGDIGGFGDGLFGDGAFNLFEGNFLDGLLGEFGNIFEHGGGAFRGVLGDAEFIGHARTSGSFFEFFTTATDAVFDYQIWSDVFGKKGSYQDFKRAYSGAFKESIEGVREVLKGHAFLLQQLRQHAPKSEELGKLFAEYDQLGLNLPSEELTKSAYRKLSSILHPDIAGTGNENLFKQLGAANDALNESAQRKAYEDILRKNPKELEKLFTKLGSGEWEAFMNKNGPGMHKRIGTTIKQQEPTGLAKWYTELHPGAQAGIIFAGIAGVGIGAYMLANMGEKKPSKKSHTARVNEENLETAQHARGA